MAAHVPQSAAPELYDVRKRQGRVREGILRLSAACCHRRDRAHAAVPRMRLPAEPPGDYRRLARPAAAAPGPFLLAGALSGASSAAVTGPAAGSAARASGLSAGLVTIPPAAAHAPIGASARPPATAPREPPYHIAG